MHSLLIELNFINIECILHVWVTSGTRTKIPLIIKNISNYLFLCECSLVGKHRTCSQAGANAAMHEVLTGAGTGSVKGEWYSTV